MGPFNLKGLKLKTAGGLILAQLILDIRSKSSMMVAKLSILGLCGADQGDYDRGKKNTGDQACYISFHVYLRGLRSKSACGLIVCHALNEIVLIIRLEQGTDGNIFINGYSHFRAVIVAGINNRMFRQIQNCIIYGMIKLTCIASLTDCPSCAAYEKGVSREQNIIQ